MIPAAPSAAPTRPDATPPRGRVQTQQRHGIWNVTVDGAFLGDYHHREDAEAAAALARLTTRARQPKAPP